MGGPLLPGNRSVIRGRRARGLTFAELIVVTVVLLIMAAVAIPRVSPIVQNFRLRGAAWQLAGDLRLARQRSVTTQKRFRICVQSCVITVPAGSYSVERDDGTPSTARWISETGTTVKLPQDVAISATATATFVPSGTASGSTFTLSNLIGQYQVVVSPLTGQVRICQGTCS
jgi:Tfp pilus assembly protein FimT